MLNSLVIIYCGPSPVCTVSEGSWARTRGRGGRGGEGSEEKRRGEDLLKKEGKLFLFPRDL